MNGLTRRIYDFPPGVNAWATETYSTSGGVPSQLTAHCLLILLVNRPAASSGAARASFGIGMERLLVVDRDFFAGPDVSQSKEQDMTVQSSHEGIWLAGVIDVVRAVAAARAVQTEAPIDVADAQDLTIARALPSLKV